MNQFRSPKDYAITDDVRRHSDKPYIRDFPLPEDSQKVYSAYKGAVARWENDPGIEWVLVPKLSTNQKGHKRKAHHIDDEDQEMPVGKRIQ